MPPSRDDDLDWLYGRADDPGAPEPTRVLPAPPAEEPGRPGHPGNASSPGGTSYSGGAGGTGSLGPAGEAPPGAGAGGGGSAPPPGTAGARPRPGASAPRRRRHPVPTTFGVLTGLVLLAVLWLVGVPAYAWSHVPRVDATPSGQRPGNQPGKTFLLVGSDSREGLTKAQQKKLGTGNVAGQRTDTIMLLYVPPGGKPALISIPRDSYVDIPGNGKNKVNTAYAFGGPQLLVKTIEADTGLRVDGYLEIGFGGFVSVIDALDGIRMCLPNAIKDADSHLDLKKGCQTLGGTNALGYVRMRKADPRGDLGRVERQRQMLAAVVAKAASPASVLNPQRYWTLANAGADSVKLGQDTTFAQTLSMVLAMRTVANGDGLTLTVPISNPNAYTAVGSSVLWDQAKASAMFADIARGDTSGLAKYAK